MDNCFSSASDGRGQERAGFLRQPWLAGVRRMGATKDCQLWSVVVRGGAVGQGPDPHFSALAIQPESPPVCPQGAQSPFPRPYSGSCREPALLGRKLKSKSTWGRERSLHPFLHCTSLWVPS